MTRRRYWIRLLLGAGLAFGALVPQAAVAAHACTFRSATAVSFGPYNVYATVANNNGIGNLTVRCQGGTGLFTVALSTGQSNSYASRVMTSGANALNYNLYTSTARTTIWGDGSGGSSSLSVSGNSTTTLSVFGQIQAGQDAAVGNYTDTIIATVNF